MCRNRGEERGEKNRLLEPLLPPHTTVDGDLVEMMITTSRMVVHGSSL